MKQSCCREYHEYYHENFIQANLQDIESSVNQKTLAKGQLARS